MDATIRSRAMQSSATVTIVLLLIALSNKPIERSAVAAIPPIQAEATTLAEARVLNRKSKKNHQTEPPYSHSKKNTFQEPRDSDRRVVPWISIAVLMNILFFFRSFAAPFFDPLGEPRQATASSVYFSLLAFLYIWLAFVTILTVLPQFSTHYNIIIAAALFFYMVFISICALLVGRFFVRGIYYMYLFWRIGSSKGNVLESRIKGAISALSKLFIRSVNVTQQQATSNGKDNVALREVIQQPIKKPFPLLIAFHRPFRRVFQRAIFLSAVLCVIYSHCWSRTLSAFDVSRGASVICRGVFLPTLLFSSDIDQSKGTTKCRIKHSCADERSIWILWTATIIGYIFYYAMHEFTGKHHKDYRASMSQKNLQGAAKAATKMETSKSSSSSDMDFQVHGTYSDEIDDEIDDENDEADDDNEIDNRWKSISATIQKLKQMKREQPEGTLGMVSWYSNIIFSTGFDMLVSFKIFLGRFDARKMQLALLKETKSSACRIQNKSIDSINSECVFDFTDCNHNSHNNDEGFWFDFVSDCGDGFNSSYQISRMLAQPTLDVTVPSSFIPNQVGRRVLPRGKLLINGGDLAYPDPTPESYEKRFFRTFEDALPPPPSFRREYISIRKPALPVKGWKMDTATKAEDQGSGNKNHLSSYPGPCTFLIPGNHDWFDGLSTFTRYILSRDWLGGWLMPQRTSYFALKLPKGWWLLGCDLALDDDINIEQFHFFANLAESSMKPSDAVIIVSHVPHWVLNEYENHTKDSEKESNLTELIRTHLKGKLKLRLAGDLHHYTRHMPLNIKKTTSEMDTVENTSGKPMLIVSGGGGAFLHPTHCFQDQIKVGENGENYHRVCAYPSERVSRHLSWLNLWQFRWRNWRLDILWATTHFGICTSLFPLCKVYDDYLEFNPTHNFGYLLLWVFRGVFLLFSQILVSGRFSLLFTLIIIAIAYTFTDSSNLKWSTHLGWSLAHAFAHISSALVCMLFLECLTEFVVSEGLVGTQAIGAAANTQSCGTGLATSIFDEYTIHFSHTLEDFQLLNATDSTFHDPPDLFPSCRYDESLYEMVSHTLSWLYHEAPFLKTTLAVFDLPGIIGSTHINMCDKLCSGGTECTWSSAFLRYQELDRITILKYLAAISLYFVIFAVPIAGNVFGTWLAITLNYFNCQYDEGFSSLRMENWKNFLRIHINADGDLEIFAIGLRQVPKKWRKNQNWEGDLISSKEALTEPSWMWKNPSKWTPWRKRKKFAPQIIDYSKINRATS
mmetsp:Transcript_868/g.1806  ORF Transcript_868/g.1806 Transcript_868/m.1806 type:complete len:1249 (-) Transcript_868:19-3765(-)